MRKNNCLQQGFCVRRAEMQNSTAVILLNFSNNINFCASISRPNAKPQNVSRYNPKNDENEKNSNITFTLDSNELRKLYDEYILCENHVKQTS